MKYIKISPDAFRIGRDLTSAHELNRSDLVNNLRVDCNLPYYRKLPDYINASDGVFVSHIIDEYNKIIRSSDYYIKTYVIYDVKLLCYKNVIYVMLDNDWVVIADSYRDIDEHWTEVIQIDGGLVSDAHVLSDSNFNNIHISSVGSSNYGHWLVDDFGRALIDVNNGKINRFIVPSFSEKINSVKYECLKAIDHACEIVFYDPVKPLLCERCMYVTPISRHPTWKSAQGLEYLVSRIEQGLSQSKVSVRHRQCLNVYVTRTTQLRKLSNKEEVESYLQGLDYMIVDTDTMSFAEQFWLFRNARSIVGIMGASMTNVMFCRDQANCIFLAPNGWDESFYWDLCAARKLSYSVIYGKTTTSYGTASYDDFIIELAELAACLSSQKIFY